jgi:hypothetical protein
MKATVLLTVPEGKRLIAKGVSQLPEVVRARAGGKILLKGGTTVSAVAEELVGAPLRISGRASPRGLKSSFVSACDSPHCMLVQGSEWRSADGELPEIVASLGASDAVVIGANIIDVHGGAAMMAGAPLGGGPGAVMTGIMAEGVPVIVAAGLEKLIPGTVSDAVRAAGRKSIDLSMGMAVGLMPIAGRVITELDALKILAPSVECQVIGRGGIHGSEGAASIVISGDESEVSRLFRLVLELKGAGTSGDQASLQECESASSKCKGHRSCFHRAPTLLERHPA